MGQPVTQHSFRGGEIAPEFYGNTRNPLHGISLRTCKNFLPIQHGALVNRPGTLDLGALASGTVRYAVFIFTDAQAFVLEFTDGLVRFWTPNGFVESAPNVPYELVTPYAAADLDRLKFAQEGDVITITCVKDGTQYAPQDLTRISNTHWTIGATSLSPPAAFGTIRIGPSHSLASFIGWDIGAAVSTSNIYNPATTYTRGAFVLYVVAGVAHLYQSRADANLGNTPNLSAVFWDDLFWLVGRTYNKGDYVWSAAGVSDGQVWISLVDNNLGIAVVAGPAWALATDTTRVPAEWQVLAVWNWVDTLGRKGDTLGCTPTPAVNIALGTDRGARYEVSDTAVPAGYTVTGKDIYRGRKGLFGLVGSMSATETFFVDDGSAPNYGTQPPRGTNPFTVSGGTKYPACVGYDNAQRRVFARSDVKPSTVFGSVVSHFDEFDENFPTQDTDAFEWKIASQILQEIRSIVHFGRLCLFTGQGEFTMQGLDGKGITANNVQAPEQSAHGSSWLDPVKVETVLLFNTAKGSYVRDFYFDYNANAFIGSDLTEYARHLFEGYTILSWAYQAKPYGVLWVVRSDGRLFSCTYNKATGTIAWARHPTRGQVLQVACIPNGTEDALMLGVIRNGGNARMERLSSRAVPKIVAGIDPETGLPQEQDDTRFFCFLDAAGQFDGRNTGATFFTVLGASYAANAVVTVQASVASFAATDLGDEVVICPDGVPAVLDSDGVEITPAVPATRITITAYTDTTHVTGTLQDDLPADFQATPTQKWGWARDTLSGLDHLNGMQVKVLADAEVQGPFTVVAGVIELDTPALIASAGLSYNSDAELLDLAADALKTSEKTVRVVTFDVVGSDGILAGETFAPADLVEAKLRTIEDDYDPTELVTGQVEVPIASSWNTGARACVRQRDPLPLTITSITRDVVVGGGS
jgi:hypothetical protein